MNAFPKIRFTLMPKWTTFTRTPSHRGVTVSPAPRSAALPRKAMNWKKTTSEMIRMYAPPRETTSGAAPNTASIGSAKRRPNSVSGIDRIAPRTRLCFRMWSASGRLFAPIARATKAIVPADTLIITLKKRKMNCPPKPTAATAAGASDPSDPTMITSTVVVKVWSRFAIMTGQASWKTEVDATFADASAVAPAIRSSNRPSLFVPWRCDVSDDLHDDLPLSRLVVQFQERDLLPGAEGRAAVDDRDREARAEESRAHMAVAVPVLPPTLMAVFHALREEPLQGVRDVLRHQTWLELVRHDCTRAARREDADEAVPDPGLRDRGLDPVRHVDRLNARLRVDPDRLSVGGHGGGKTREMQEACRPPF